MIILITGGSGLIGKPLIQSLIDHGHKIIVLSRNKKRTSGNPSIRILEWDGLTISDWRTSINHIDAIINLAGENIGSFPWTPKRKREFLNSRQNAGRVLVEWLRMTGFRPEVFIQASAVGYYGPHGEEPVDESTAPGADFSARLCIEWERSTQPVESMGVRRIIIRTGVVLAKKGGVLPLMALPVRFFLGGHLGNGRQGFPWIHIKDEVNAIRYLLEDQRTQGVYNLSASHPVPNSEFFHTLAKVLKRPYWFHAPDFAIKIALGEMSTLLLDGQYLIPRRLLDSGFIFDYDFIEPALKNIYFGD
jgi:uncharacterized protein (TIGR01777 family)